MNHPGAELAGFAAGLRSEHIPEPVVRKTEDLLVDWFASVVAGHGSRPVASIARFARAMGPNDGPSEVIVERSRTTPNLAALANAAALHVAEQDDVQRRCCGLDRERSRGQRAGRLASRASMRA